jgi:hypothetical protein
MVEVIATDEFTAWYRGLQLADAVAVTRSVERLEAEGLGLGFPPSSDVKGTKRHAIRELRIQSGGRPLRVLYAFDPRRQAVLLIGGDKTGDTRFYGRMVPVAERILDVYLAEQHTGLHEEDEP